MQAWVKKTWDRVKAAAGRTAFCRFADWLADDSIGDMTSLRAAFDKVLEQEKGKPRPKVTVDWGEHAHGPQNEMDLMQAYGFKLQDHIQTMRLLLGEMDNTIPKAQFARDIAWAGWLIAAHRAALEHGHALCPMEELKGFNEFWKTARRD